MGWGGGLGCWRVVRCSVPLHVAVVYLDHAGKKNGEEGDEQKCKGKYVLAGEVSHKWQPYSASDNTIVK